MSNLIGIDGGQVSTKQAPPVSAAAASRAIQALEIINPDDFYATRFNILVKVVDVSAMSDGGLFLPEKFFTKMLFDKTRAVLILAGDEAFTGSSGLDWRTKPKIGDTVVMSKNAGNLYRDEACNLYRHAHDIDICFVEKGNK